MLPIRRQLLALTALALVVAACATPGGPVVTPIGQGTGSTGAPSAAETSAASPAAETPGTPDATPDGASGSTPAPAATQEASPQPQVEGWRGMPLEDARTGETFTIAGLAGKLVAIEPMAAWCSNCLTQQKEARKALEKVASDDVVYISLGVDPNEKPKDLAAYADDKRFDWTFAVASKDVARALAAEFGDQVLSPPSVPFILVGADGTLLEQHFGSRSADDLAVLLAANLP